MARKAFKIVIVLFTLLVSENLTAQAITEEAARAELVKRGYDPDRFAEEFLKRGIDVKTIDFSNPAELDKYKKVGEEIMKSLDEEGKSTKSGGVSSETDSGDNKKSEKEVEDKVQQIVDDINEIVDGSELSNISGSTIVTYGQHIFSNKSLKVFKKVDEVRPTKAYVLGPGDKVSISIWGPTQENFSLEIQKEGYIQPTGLPRIFISGLTLAEAEQLVYAKLKSKYFFQKENFALKITTARNINVNIVGEVLTNGTYNISAVNTAFNAIMAAGGPTELGSIRKIQVLSVGKKPVTLDVYKYLQNPSESQSFYLSENDYIHIPVAERLVTVSGEINRPFRYELTGNEQLRELIQFAGGLKAGAYRKTLQVKRLENDTVRIIDLDLVRMEKNGDNFILFNGDQIVIKKVREEVVNEVSVTGAVEQPGNYAVNETTRVSDVLLKAGLLQSALLDFGYIFRAATDQPKTQEYIQIDLKKIIEKPASESDFILKPKDRIFIYFKDNYADESFVRVDGAVRSAGTFLYNASLTLTDALRLAGGLKREASRSRIDLYRLDFSNDVPAKVITTTIKINDSLSVVGLGNDFKLKPFDQIFVRLVPEFELQRNVLISGEVKYPGEYALMGDNHKLSSLIQMSGGLTSESFPKGATLLRKQENTGFIIIDLEKAISNPGSFDNIILQNGDEIIIPKINNLVSIEGATKAYELYPEKILKQNKIQVAYRAGKNARFYIDEFAGGLSEEASASKVSVIDASGRLLKTRNYLLFKTYPIVGPGSQIKVGFKDKKDKNKDKGEKNEVKWGDILANSIAQATAILSLILLIQNVN